MGKLRHREDVSLGQGRHVGLVVGNPHRGVRAYLEPPRTEARSLLILCAMRLFGWILLLVGLLPACVPLGMGSMALPSPIESTTLRTQVPPADVVDVASRLLRTYGFTILATDATNGIVQTDFQVLADLHTEQSGLPSNRSLERTLIRIAVNAEVAGRGTSVEVIATYRPVGVNEPELPAIPRQFWVDEITYELAQRVSAAYDRRVEPMAYVTALEAPVGSGDPFQDAVRRFRRGAMLSGIVLGSLVVLSIVTSFMSGV